MANVTTADIFFTSETTEESNFTFNESSQTWSHAEQSSTTAYASTSTSATAETELVSTIIVATTSAATSAIQNATVQPWFEDGVNLIIKFHGIFMIAAWIVLLPLSMLILDNYHQTIPKKLYFQIYGPMRLAGLVLAIISFTLIVAILHGRSYERNSEHFNIGVITIAVMFVNAVLVFVYQRRRKRGVTFKLVDKIIKPINVLLTLGNDILAKRVLMNGLEIIECPSWVTGCVMVAAMVHAIVLITLKMHQCVYTPRTKTSRQKMMDDIIKFDIVENESDFPSNLNLEELNAVSTRDTEDFKQPDSEAVVESHASVKYSTSTDDDLGKREASEIEGMLENRVENLVEFRKPQRVDQASSHRSTAPRPSLSRLTSSVDVFIYNKFRIFLLHLHAAVMLILAAIIVTGLLTYRIHLNQVNL